MPVEEESVVLEPSEGTQEKPDIEQHALASDIHEFLVQDFGQTQRFQPCSRFGALTD